MTLIERLEAGPGSRELSDECLLAVGWRVSTVNGITTWYSPRGLSHGILRYPDTSQNLQDALDWLVPEGWHVSFLAAGDRDMGVNNTNRYPRCSVSPNLNNDEGWKRGIAVCEKAATPALALCAASLKARAGHEN